VRQRQRLLLSLDHLMFIERIPVPTRTPKLWHATWWEAAATGWHAQSTTQVTTGNSFARLRTCQHRRHELFHLHPILCRLPLARHRSFSILAVKLSGDLAVKLRGASQPRAVHADGALGLCALDCVLASRWRAKRDAATGKGMLLHVLMLTCGVGAFTCVLRADPTDCSHR
jgi:hypothetical protein